jgi:hypothetical protein
MSRKMLRAARAGLKHGDRSGSTLPHQLQFVSARVTLFTRRYMEDWVCNTCGVRVILKGRVRRDVAVASAWLSEMHRGRMSSSAVLRIFREGRRVIQSGTVPDYLTSDFPLDNATASDMEVDGMPAPPYLLEREVSLWVVWRHYSIEGTDENQVSPYGGPSKSGRNADNIGAGDVF